MLPLTDPIGDLIARMRNAQNARRSTCRAPHSRIKKQLCEVLKREGYIWDWEEMEGRPTNLLRVHLKYGPNGERVIRRIRRVSKPGRRVYSGAAAMKPVLGGLGICIISTSRGVISDREARQRKLGGEVLCEVW